jgi:hypothetical protein
MELLTAVVVIAGAVAATAFLINRFVVPDQEAPEFQEHDCVRLWPWATRRHQRVQPPDQVGVIVHVYVSEPGLFLVEFEDEFGGFVESIDVAEIEKVWTDGR